MDAGNASPLELVWLLVASVSLLAALVDTVRAVGEVWLHRRDDGPEHGISISGLYKSALLLAMTLVGLAIGIVAVQTPEPRRDELQDYQQLVSLGLIAYAVLLLGVIAIKDWERLYVAQWEWVARRRGRPSPEADADREQVTP